MFVDLVIEQGLDRRGQWTGAVTPASWAGWGEYETTVDLGHRERDPRRARLGVEALQAQVLASLHVPKIPVPRLVVEGRPQAVAETLDRKVMQIVEHPYFGRDKVGVARAIAQVDRAFPLQWDERVVIYLLDDPEVLEPLGLVASPDEPGGFAGATIPVLSDDVEPEVVGTRVVLSPAAYDVGRSLRATLLVPSGAYG